MPSDVEEDEDDSDVLAVNDYMQVVRQDMVDRLNGMYTATPCEGQDLPYVMEHPHKTPGVQVSACSELLCKQPFSVYSTTILCVTQ